MGGWEVSECCMGQFERRAVERGNDIVGVIGVVGVGVSGG